MLDVFKNGLLRRAVLAHAVADLLRQKQAEHVTEFRREFLARDQQKILRNLQLLVRLKQPVVLADCHPVQTA